MLHYRFNRFEYGGGGETGNREDRRNVAWKGREREEKFK
jgi:hypothetical protein